VGGASRNMSNGSRSGSAARIPRRAGVPFGPTDLLTAAVLSAAAAAISIPLLRMWPPTGDEGAMLTGAVKLLRGGIFYRNIAAYPTPGAWYLLAGAMRLVGESVITARVLTLIAFALTVGFFYLIARPLLGAQLALAYGVGLLAVKLWAWPAWSAYLYADVAFVFAAAAALAFLAGWQRRRGRHFFIAGLLFGAATLCKQTVGIYPAGAGLAVLVLAPLATRRPASHAWLRRVLGLADDQPWAWAPAWLLVAGGLAAFIIPVLYFGRHGLLGEMVTAGLVRPLAGYLPTSAVSYTEMLDWSHFRSLTESAFDPYRVPVLSVSPLAGSAPMGQNELWRSLTEFYVRMMYLLVPLFLLAPALHLVWKARRNPAAGEPHARQADAAALALMVGLFASAFPRADYYHVIDVAPAWLLALFMGAAGWAEAARERRGRLIRGGVAVAGVAWLAVGAFAMATLSSRCDLILNLPHFGRVRAPGLYTDLEPTVAYIRSHTAPDAPLFVLGSEAYFYFLTDRYSPWPFAQTYPGQTGDDMGQRLAGVIEQHRIPYVIRGRRAPGLPILSSYAPALLRYIARHYHEIRIPGTHEPSESRLLQRNDLPTTEEPEAGPGARKHNDLAT
jgi:hypothetical protein